jgi:hypothetical protein
MPNGLQQTDKVPPLASMALGALLFVVAGFWLLTHDEMSLLLALLVSGILLAVYSVYKSAAMYLCLFYLLFLGDIRRIWSWIYGFPENDPLILVGTLFALFITVPLFFRLRVSDTVSKLCLGLLFVMALQIFNPAQGGLLVGFSGVIYIMTPVLWFWIGRTYGSEALLRILLHRILLPAALIASAYGYYQTTVGLSPWQSAWVDHVGSAYGALHLGHSIRAFGFSPSSSEYVNMLGMATLVALAGFLGGRRVMILPLAVLLPSLLLAGSRGTFVRVLFSGAMAFSFTGQKKGPSTARFVTAIGFGVCGLALILSGYGNGTPAGKPKTAAETAIAHQVEGLSDPFHSTAVGHTTEIYRGIFLALRHPAGFGLGSTTIASKFSSGGDSDLVASEFDLTDTFINLGMPGGLLYLGFIVYMYRASIRYISFGPGDLSLPVFGILAAFLGDWLFPGEYGNGPILWLAAGCVVRFVISADAAAKAENEAAEVEQQAVAVAS